MKNINAVKHHYGYSLKDFRTLFRWFCQLLYFCICPTFLRSPPDRICNNVHCPLGNWEINSLCFSFKSEMSTSHSNTKSRGEWQVRVLSQSHNGDVDREANIEWWGGGEVVIGREQLCDTHQIQSEMRIKEIACPAGWWQKWWQGLLYSALGKGTKLGLHTSLSVWYKY